MPVGFTGSVAPQQSCDCGVDPRRTILTDARAQTRAPRAPGPPAILTRRRLALPVPSHPLRTTAKQRDARGLRTVKSLAVRLPPLSTWYFHGPGRPVSRSGSPPVASTKPMSKPFREPGLLVKRWPAGLGEGDAVPPEGGVARRV